MTGHELLDLSEVLAHLGHEFRVAAQRDSSALQWYDATVVLHTVVSRDTDGSVKFWVIDVDGGYSYQKTIKLSINLAPYVTPHTIEQV